MKTVILVKALPFVKIVTPVRAATQLKHTARLVKVAIRMKISRYAMIVMHAKSVTQLRQRCVKSVTLVKFAI